MDKDTNKLPDEFKYEPETKIGKKLDNFWYYHKWKVIVCIFIAVIVIICAVQCATRLFLPEEKGETLCTFLERLCFLAIACLGIWDALALHGGFLLLFALLLLVLKKNTLQRSALQGTIELHISNEVIP